MYAYLYLFVSAFLFMQDLKKSRKCCRYIFTEINIRILRDVDLLLSFIELDLKLTLD